MHSHIIIDFTVITPFSFQLEAGLLEQTIEIYLLPVRTITKLPLTLMEAKLSLKHELNTAGFLAGVTVGFSPKGLKPCLHRGNCSAKLFQNNSPTWKVCEQSNYFEIKAFLF